MDIGGSNNARSSKPPGDDASSVADAKAVESVSNSGRATSYREATLPVELSEEPDNVERRIHIIGTGSIGKLIAHSLRDLPNPPPVTLIFHTSRHYGAWQKSQQEIIVTTEGIPVAREGFDAELSPAGFRRHGKRISRQEYKDSDGASGSSKVHEQVDIREDEDLPDSGLYIPEDSTSSEPIHNLILSVKAGTTVPALSRVKHRLGPESAVLFLQNGMGQVDEVNEKVFPDPETRPNYLAGIISHGVHSPNPFEAVHAGFGTIAIGVPPAKPSPTEQVEIPSAALDTTSPSSRYLLRTLCRSPVLAAVPNSPTELFQAQLEKLAVNAIVNPITALMDARNGAMTYNYSIQRAMRLMLGEISLVIRSLPELAALPNVNTRFAPDRLETLCISVAHRTRNNISSMLADTRQGSKTEVQYINGYLVKRGEELGITCYMNYLISQLVEGKSQLIGRERDDALPFTGVR